MHKQFLCSSGMAFHSGTNTQMPKKQHILNFVRGTCTVSQITTAVTWPKPAEVRGHLQLAH